MFQFKQFTIQQEKCAMKVTEIACILGAWTQIPSGATHVLDIGSGTGLLSLMLAQRFPDSKIDAIEIDEASFHQGSENILHSPFASKIKNILADVTCYIFEKKYEHIIVNPPFFENQLKSPDGIKNKAWHSTHLTLSTLFEIIKTNLNDKGNCSILLPIERKTDLENLIKVVEFHFNKILLIKPNEKSVVKYFIATFSFEKKSVEMSELIVKENGIYTSNAIDLFKAFYLKL